MNDHEQQYVSFGSPFYVKKRLCPQPVFGWQQNWVNFVSDTTVRSNASVSTLLPFLNIAHFCSVATGFKAGRPYSTTFRWALYYFIFLIVLFLFFFFSNFIKALHDIVSFVFQ